MGGPPTWSPNDNFLAEEWGGAEMHILGVSSECVQGWLPAVEELVQAWSLITAFSNFLLPRWTGSIQGFMNAMTVLPAPWDGGPNVSASQKSILLLAFSLPYTPTYHLTLPPPLLPPVPPPSSDPAGDTDLALSGGAMTCVRLQPYLRPYFLERFEAQAVTTPGL